MPKTSPTCTRATPKHANLAADAPIPTVVCQPIWVSINDAMRLSGLGRTTIYDLLATDRLRSITVGRRRLISVASIEALGGEA